METPRETEDLESYIRNSAPLLEDVTVRSFFNNKEQWVNKFIHPTARTKDWELIVDEIEDKQIYTWPLFTNDFCDQIIQAAEEKDDWRKKRHDFYPTTDKLLEAFGMDKIYSEILEEFVYPAARELYELSGKSWENIGFENFIAKYEAEGNCRQISLGIHHDTSLITSLVNLSQEGEDYEGGGTFFKKQKVLVRPPKGNVTIHPGAITHKHGARPTTKGKRYIIVSFSRFLD